MKKRARICLYIFLVCAFVLLSIGGYFIFSKPNENVRVGRKFVTFNSVDDATSYVVSVERDDGEALSKDVVYKVEKTQSSGDSSNTSFDYAIDVSIDDNLVAKESYTQTIINEDKENNLIDCVISNYTIFFLSDNSSVTYPDQTLNGVDRDIFCCVVSEYFDETFDSDGEYTLICKSYDSDGVLIEEDSYDYNYFASYKEDFVRRGEYYYKGTWYDYIIENKDELNNLVWYAILYRLGDGEDLSFYVESKDITSSNINNLVIDAINNYPEYDALEDSYVYAKLEGNIGHLVNFDYYLDSDFLLTYKDLYSMDTSRNKQYYKYALSNLNKKDDNYFQGYIEYVEPLQEEPIDAQDEEQMVANEPSSVIAQSNVSQERTFAIDSVQDEVVVYNTEQLFMVVQSGAKPIFVTGKSDVAKTVYENALEVLKQINNSDNLSDFEKVTNIYRYITGEIIYDYALYAYMEAKNDYSIKNFGNFSSFYLEGVFYDFDGLSEHYAVCDGLSKAFSLMCNIEGIDCIKVNGVVEGGNHAWNRVYLKEDSLDGWYYVDTTWGEGNYSGEDAEYQILTHTYFLFDLDSSQRKITYPENLESISPSSSADYYRIATYNDGEEEHDFYIISDDELKNALEYAQTSCDENDNFVLEIEFDKSYYSNESSAIHDLTEIQRQIEKLENLIENEKHSFFGSPINVMKYETQLDNLKKSREKWFENNGIADSYEWLQVGYVIIFRTYK